MPGYRPFRWRPGLINVATVAGLLLVASFLPADTSLSELRRAGVLRVCVPDTRPPLVTGTPEAPGFDVELLEDLARRMGMRLSLRVSPAMGRDFNPRNWRLNRSQCELIAGGLVDGPDTQNFLQVIPTGAMTGWAMATPVGAALRAGDTVAVLPVAGLDRLALSHGLRERGVSVRLISIAEEMANMISDGTAVAGISDRATAGMVAAKLDLETDWVTIGELAPQSFALGAWKGDVTLRRAFARHVAEAEADGTLQRLRGRYGLRDGSRP
jgi:ABC-type amino acid transport substrate-binding protein